MNRFLYVFLMLFFLNNNIDLLLAESNNQEAVNFVEHKNDTLIQYLDLISGNLKEKIGLLPYIKNNKAGTFLEVGAGGDSIAFLLSEIPNDCNVTIIASDIDEKVVQSIPHRHPEIKGYMSNSSNIKLRLKQLDATNMTKIYDNSLDGINASALVHEIISYAGGGGISRFFKEASRILKDDGVLVYRDPEGVSLESQMVSMQIISKNMKLFINTFLPKFLDRQYTKQAKKIHSYDIDSIKMELYLKTDLEMKELTFNEFLAVPTSLIDFEKTFILFLPQGLEKEIERHYLTFLHQCNPVQFVKLVLNSEKDGYEVEYYTEEVQAKFFDFCRSHEIVSNKCFALEEANVIQQLIEDNISCLENGISLCFQNSDIKKLFIDFLKKNKISELFIDETSSSSLMLDYRIFGLLYEDIKELFLKNFKTCEFNYLDEEIAKYLKREGEEHYFYLSPDEFIAYVGEETLTELTCDAKILAPINAQSNYFIARSGYQDLLQQNCLIKDFNGNTFLPREGKRIIHFAKMSVEKAYKVYLEIIEQNPQEYFSVANFVERKLKPLICN